MTVDNKLCLALCTPHYDRPNLKFVASCNLLWKPSSIPGAQIPGLGTHRINTVGKPVSIARNMITGDALAAEPKATHLLWVDDDMEFPEDALAKLLAHDVPIVGGLCHSRHFPYHPILGKTHHDGRGYGFCYHYPPNSLFEVDVTGGAFLLIKREVFEKMNEAGFAGKWWSERNERSEDFSFCELARSLGYKIYVDTGLEIGHATEIMLTSQTARALRPFEWEAWMPDPGVQPGEPLATIVIPTYNQDIRWLKTAVQSASRQTVPVEVIIVDDGSTPPVRFDGWPDNVRVVAHVKDEEGEQWEMTADPGDEALYRAFDPDNRGISAALNTGIAHMRTKWFCWLSSDDILDPRKVQMQLSALLQSGGKLSFHRYQTIEAADGKGFSKYGLMPRWRTIEEQKTILAKVCAINGSTVMISKNVFEDLGVFDEEFKYGQDYEAWCRYGQKYFWYGLEEILGTRRELKTNLTSTLQASPEGDARRLRRDAEDSAIRAQYAWPR